MTTDRLKDAAKTYLEQQSFTVFGEFFDIKDDKRRDDAAEFLARHMRGVLAVRQEQTEEPLPEYKGEDIDVEEVPVFDRVYRRYFNRLSKVSA